MDRYEQLEKIGAGTFVENSIIALKIIRASKESRRSGVDFTALREIKTLGELDHVNIIKLWECFTHQSAVVLVLELCVTDVDKIIKDTSVDLTSSHVKSIMHMLMNAVDFMHRNWILHLDLKPDNLLVNSNGVVKVTDFGLARPYGKKDEGNTSKEVVITIYYRPLELLFGAKKYGGAVDIWSCGCIFAELILRNPYMPGTSEIDQTEKIFQARGSPTHATWPNLPEPDENGQIFPTDELPTIMYPGYYEGTPFKDIAVQWKRPCEDVGVHLMDGMPNQQPSAATLDEMVRLLPTKESKNDLDDVSQKMEF
eukprot:g9086.t1